MRRVASADALTRQLQTIGIGVGEMKRRVEGLVDSFGRVEPPGGEPPAGPKPPAEKPGGGTYPAETQPPVAGVPPALLRGAGRPGGVGLRPLARPTPIKGWYRPSGT